MPRLRSTVLPAALATLSLAVAAGPATAASRTAPTITPDEAAALQQAATTRDGGTADLTTTVTKLLGLPGEGALQAAFELVGLPSDQAQTLARQISRLPTALTVPGGLGG